MTIAGSNQLEFGLVQQMALTVFNLLNGLVVN
jgi:hypothetical protein